MKPLLVSLLVLVAVSLSQKIVCRPQCWGTVCTMVCDVVPF